VESAGTELCRSPRSPPGHDLRLDEHGTGWSHGPARGRRLVALRQGREDSQSTRGALWLQNSEGQHEGGTRDPRRDHVRIPKEIVLIWGRLWSSSWPTTSESPRRTEPPKGARRYAAGHVSWVCADKEHSLRAKTVDFGESLAQCCLGDRFAIQPDRVRI